ncbi:MAG: endo-1,4-beta-xylanase, partial [Anaerolineae bacterium]|nr:endo-1,4-beta-xylanase [Anaerolineae bacterium]
MKQTKSFALVKVSLFLLLSIFLSVSASSHAAEPGPSLRDATAGTNRLVGSAINYQALTTDPVYAEIAASEFDVIVPENEMKMKYLQPSQGNYDFGRADTIVQFAVNNGMEIRGHTLIWHENVPSWIYNRSWTRDELLAVMEDHIHTVVGRYRGQIYAWDVVNEAIDWDGNYRRSVWYNVIGPEFMDYAFQYAHEADPDALLFYNDYSAEEMTHKADIIYNIVADMVARGVPIDGVGMQMHRSVSQGTRIDSVRQNMERLADLGLQVQFTEIDIRMGTTGGSQQEKLQKQADEYRAITEVCAQTPACTAILTWGFTDRYTWIESRFGSDQIPMPFDVNYQPKPAYFSYRDMVAVGVPAIGGDTGTPYLLANDDSYGGQQDQPLSVSAPGVVANDETELGSIQVVNYTQPANGSVVVNSDGSFNYAPFAGFRGYDEFSYTITDGKSQRSATVSITVQPSIPTVCSPVYRVNAGGEEIPAEGMAWSADTEATPSAYVNAEQSSNKTTTSTDPVSMAHPSLTPEVPMILFQTERYNNNAGVALRWGFPVAQGTYTVNLYLAERYFDLAGNRAYDVSIEGQQVLDNFDPYTIAGADAGFVQSFVVQSDTILNIEFTNVIQNAAVMGIEIIAGSGCVSEPPVTNTPPVAAADASSTVAGMAVTIPVLSNDTDADGDALSLAGVTEPQNGTVVMGDTQITYQPNAGFTGTDSFTYTISDGTDTATATVTIEVTPEIVEPTQTPPPVETEEPGPDEQIVCEPIYRVNAGGDEIVAADADQGFPNWSADTSSSPSAYVNAQQSSNNTARTDTAIDMSDVSLTGLVDVVPQALFQTERYNTNADTPMVWSFSMPAGEYSVRLYLAELYFEQAGNRAYDVLIEGQQVLDNFEPIAYAGTDMRGFMQQYDVITDGLLEIEFVNQLQNASVMGLEILVCGTGNKTVNVPPTPANDEVNVMTGVPASIDPLQNDSDPDGDELTLVDVISTSEQTVSTTIIMGSAGGRMEQDGNLLTYTSAPDFEGTEIFAYTVSDGSETATALITVHVSAPVEVTPTPPTDTPTEEPTAEPTEPPAEPTETGDLGAPSITPVSDQNTAAGSSASLQIQAVDPDGGALRYIAEGLPAGLGIDAASGLISGTPTQAGTYPVALRVVAPDGDEGTAS